MGRIMAIDYGLKRVGIAVTDPLQLIASPLTTVATKEIFAWIHDYAKKEPIETFVVGFPGDLKDPTLPIIQAIANFVQILQKQFPSQKVRQQDERYTSKIALASLVAVVFK
eukprot:gene576-721_t